MKSKSDDAYNIHFYKHLSNNHKYNRELLVPSSQKVVVNALFAHYLII